MSAAVAKVRSGKAILRMPKGQQLVASRSLKTAAKAMPFVPKGQSSSAKAAPSRSAAKAVVPKGRTTRAAEHPSTAPKPFGRTSRAKAATTALPKGQTASAPSLPSCSESVTRRMPKGHDADAGPSTQSESKAIRSMPEKAIAKLPSSPLSPIADTIRELHRQRQDFHRAEKSLTLQVKAICRRLCAGDKDAAEVLYGQIGKETTPLAVMAEVCTGPFFQARSILEGNRKRVEKMMERETRKLPVVAFVESVKGFGIGSLAAIVGEAGDLGNYSTHSKLWKRLGLAPYNGKAASTWRREGGLTSADWQQLGYSPSRRSIVWNIGACIFKSQSARIDKETGEVKTPAGPYRLLYDARKELELARVESKGHAHNRALRYIEKRLIRELWRAWRA